jgi:ABC-type dipeptide/oligopeptide/nickel transport system ATPase subunit
MIYATFYATFCVVLKFARGVLLQFALYVVSKIGKSTNSALTISLANSRRGECITSAQQNFTASRHFSSQGQLSRNFQLITIDPVPSLQAPVFNQPQNFYSLDIPGLNKQVLDKPLAGKVSC